VRNKNLTSLSAESNFERGQSLLRASNEFCVSRPELKALRRENSVLAEKTYICPCFGVSTGLIFRASVNCYTMKILIFLFSIWMSFAAGAREIDDFVNIAESGTYDFGGKTLFIKDGANTPAIVIGDPFNETPSFIIKNVTLKNVTIYGNEKNQTSEYHSKYPFLRNNGITIRGGQNVTVENVTVIGARSGGLVTEKNSSNIKVLNSIFAENYFDGVAACETTYSQFTNLLLSRNKYSAISLDWRVQNCLFQNILSYRNRDWTLFSRASKTNTFSKICSILNGGSYFVAKNIDVVGNEGSSVIWREALFWDRRGYFVDKCCFSDYTK
jgi:hypothetical protein